ncbi:FAD-dependent oxidoreductase [Microcoleus sp. FACHB-68]|uniref:FAD-dependent oxidoreductase n=1 Tax=Microcoleus sp. FACHB-68 TaxID=2692826 RepID=UPI001687248A|nr:FAD-dependent oxidoreductase [Microcoleus sp. FACHB-68]MBD1936812.1 FAD-dependent oxidoreductase [Microcoleus sp. FACHB-68]
MTLPNQPLSFWRKTTAETHFPQLITDISVDVTIVGAGITGLTTALLLKRAGLKVAVIEAFKIGHGTTGSTTAHLSEVPDAGYQTLISNFGKENTRLVAQSRRAAIELIAGFVAQGQIACHFQRVPGYLYTESREEIEYLQEEVQAANNLGVTASLTTDVPLPFPLHAGILFPNQAQFHPMEYLHALAGAIEGDGCHIFERTRVTDITDDVPCRVYTDRGSVKAQNVILATHTPIHDLFHLPDLLLMTTKIAAYRSYVLGVRLVEKRFGPTSPIPVGLFWDTAEPYHYTRTHTDSAGQILLVGGEDHKTGQDVDTEACFQRLEEYVRGRYEVSSIDCKWSAQLYEPVDGLPFIGKPGVHSHLYIATGYSGNGITFGTVAAMLLADLVQGKPNPWRDVYDPNRVPVAGASRLMTENLNVATHLIADRFKSDASRLSEVRPNEGKIVDVNGEKLAIYRDEAGTIHALSPVCSHATCIVHWNNTEKSWDCPCHGGRYSPTGQVLNGPPINGLQPKKIAQI